MDEDLEADLLSIDEAFTWQQHTLSVPAIWDRAALNEELPSQLRGPLTSVYGRSAEDATWSLSKSRLICDGQSFTTSVRAEDKAAQNGLGLLPWTTFPRRGPSWSVTPVEMQYSHFKTTKSSLSQSTT